MVQQYRLKSDVLSSLKRNLLVSMEESHRNRKEVLRRIMSNSISLKRELDHKNVRWWVYAKLLVGGYGGRRSLPLA